MKGTGLQRLHPDLTVIMEELADKGIECRREGNMEERCFLGVRLYSPRLMLRENVIYVLRPADVGRFPVDAYPYVCTVPAPGHSDHLFCQGQDPEALFEVLQDLFSRLREMEMVLDEMVYSNGSLQELCEAGARMLGNPVCVHDDWFIVIAMTRELPSVMAPEYIMASSKAFVPQAVVEDFKFDNDYLETYESHSAQLWIASPTGASCLYVNMWEGTVYRGRLLVMKHHRDFRHLDYRIAEVLTQRAMILLRQKQMGEDHTYRSMDDIVYDILNHKLVDAPELRQFLGMMDWGKGDTLLCIRIQSQQFDSAPVTSHLLHSDLFRVFTDSYIMFAGNQQCVLMNMTKQRMPFSQLRHRLALLCRDYCLYAGISSPVNGMGELHLAYHQAEVALNEAFRQKNERWIYTFSQCVLDYVLNNQSAPLQPHHLVAPELFTLLKHDRENDTRYFDTLRVYLQLERDIPRCSEALIIHRTTLQYRLKKIRKLTELDLDDPDVRLYLLLSLRILERERLLPEESEQTG